MCNGSDNLMADSDHEEADTRIVLHVIDSLQEGATKILIRTVDTDVIVILIGQFHNIIDQYHNAQLWVAFGTGKNFYYYSINSICETLGRLKSPLSPSISRIYRIRRHDTTSSFFGKTKKSGWNTWEAYPEVSTAFLHMTENAFDEVSLTSSHFLLLQRFTVLLYDKTSNLESDEARLDLFCKKVGVWKTCLQPRYNNYMQI